MIQEKIIDMNERELEFITNNIISKKAEMEKNILAIGQLLVVVKEKLGHGQFGKWLEEKVEFKKSTANNFMRCYTEFSNFQTFGDLGQSKIFALLDVKKDDREDFINNTHEVDGANKTIHEMSVRELHKVIKDYKKSKKKIKEVSPVIEVNKDEMVEVNKLPIQPCEDIQQVLDSVIQLNEELKLRTGSVEEIETTLVAVYKAGEISHEQFIKIIMQEKLKLPIFFDKSMQDDYFDNYNNDYYSAYEQYDDKAETNRTYYSLFDKNFEWKEVIKPKDDDEDTIDWCNSNHIDNGEYQLAFGYDANGYITLCAYQNYEIIASFTECEDIADVNKVATYHGIDGFEYTKLFKQLLKQKAKYDQRNKVRQEKRQKEYEKKRKQQEKYRETLESWKTYYQPYSMGKYKFEDIWDENGQVKNYKLWNEMTTFCNQQRSKQYDSSWKDYDFGKMFGNNTPAIKEEDKPLYKKMYKKLAMVCHPDKGGTLEDMQFVNKLKEDWGI